MDKRICDELTKNYYCRWNDQEDHITGFARCLGNDQAKLCLDGLVISDVDKLQHYMLQMWNCNLFDQLTMTEWTIKRNDERTFENAVLFFNQKTRNLEAYEAASGNKNSFEAANAAVEIADLINSQKETNEAAATTLLQRDEEHALATRGLREETDSSTRQLRSDIDKLTSLVQSLASRSPKQKQRVEKSVRFKEDDDSESDDDLPPTPPPKKKTKRQKGNQRTKGFEVGKSFKPGMEYDKSWDGKKIHKFYEVRKEYNKAHPEWAKKERLAYFRRELEKGE